MANSGNSSSHPSSIVYCACIPFILGYFSGVGDFFSVLVLSHYGAADNNGSAPSPPTLLPLPHAISLALIKMHAVLCLTVKYASLPPPDECTTI
jgi:pyridoxine kinase